MKGVSFGQEFVCFSFIDSIGEIERSKKILLDREF